MKLPYLELLLVGTIVAALSGERGFPTYEEIPSRHLCAEQRELLLGHHQWFAFGFDLRAMLLEERSERELLGTRLGDWCLNAR